MFIIQSNIPTYVLRCPVNIVNIMNIVEKQQIAFMASSSLWPLSLLHQSFIPEICLQKYLFSEPIDNSWWHLLLQKKKSISRMVIKENTKYPILGWF